MPNKNLPVQPPSIEFIKNKGQWKKNIQFRSNLPGGKLYFESDKLTYVFYSQEDIDRLHDLHHGKRRNVDESEMIVDAHLFNITFPGANKTVRYKGKKIKPHYVNYFLGSDERYWASKVPVYTEAYAKDLWDGIDYRVYSNDIDLKYDFIVHPGAETDRIAMTFNHLENIKLKYGNLYLITSVNEMIDLKPVAYQNHESGRQYIPCSYSLKGKTVSFEFPEGYDKSRKLVIDPQLIFSSFSGSTQDNWGFTATFDNGGNLYGGGIVFSDTTKSYPTTSGAFQINQAGGGIDIGITKFNSSGTNLIYSTYLGGSKNEIPHSMVVNQNGELIVMGTTSSPDYPVTSTAYDTSYNISGTATIQIASRTFLGSDIVITKFNPTGTGLNGSTYIGGTSFDGFNYNNLDYNYGDEVRGEVVAEGNDVYVASTTSSTNFPVTNSSIHRGGTQEAVAFKLDSSLSNLLWSTYIGGNGNDAAYSIQVDNSGKSYVAGGTASSNFPTTAGVINPSALGGIDGFVCVIDAGGSGLSISTRIGTNSYDQCYFVQLDDSNNVFVTGQTTGNYSITPSTVYRNQYSGQFIHKMDPTLSSTVFSTVIGTGGSSSNIAVDISPSAFLVNQCNHIYLSGWGGDINAQYAQATASTTTGLPVTPGAYNTTTDGNDFYLIVLDEDADSLLYATFFGGSSGFLRGEHVDGGTSRFDKKGIVYQAVCAGCGGSNSFPTAPSNVYAPNNGSSNCNLGVIKFDLSQLTSDVGMAALTKVCIPGTVTFNNNSNGGNQYFWDFGDGNTSTQFQPTHTYIDTGLFTVMLVVSDSLSCILQDTAYVDIKGEGPPVATADTVPISCPGDSVQLQAFGGIKYLWFPNGSTSNDTISNPTALPPTSMTYTVVVGDSCGSDTSNYFAYDTTSVSVILAQDNSSISPNDTICKGESIQLVASGGIQYTWSPPLYLNKFNVADPVSTPQQTITYVVEIIDQYNCTWGQQVVVTVEDSLNPMIISTKDTVICLGDTIEIFSSGGKDYSWFPGSLTLDSLNDTTLIWPTSDQSFIVSIMSKCFKTSDTVVVGVKDFQTEAMPDTFACLNVPVKLIASPGEIFAWEPNELLDSGLVPKARITEPTTFVVTAYDDIGCMSEDSVFIDLRDPPYVSAGNDQVISKPSTRLEASGNGTFLWDPAEFLNCPECRETEAEVPGGTTLFTVTLTDVFGCINSDDVLVTRIDNDLFVPNSFTPNNDDKNDVFKPFGYNLQDYQITIFNRWGEVVFRSSDLETGWDGTFKGKVAENGVYVWEINYIQNGKEEKKRGTVSLVR